MGSLPLTLPDSPGAVAEGLPRLGIFVLPDNQSDGTLEDILLECANLAYSDLRKSAETHVQNALTDTTLNSHDKKDISKPSGIKKAVVGSMASILRPGKAIQTSLQDNRRLDPISQDLPKIQVIQKFLEDLMEIPPSASKPLP